MSNADTHKHKYATAYEQTLCYGGPEEGGWWYTHLSPVLSVEVGEDEDAAYEEAHRQARERGLVFKGDLVTRSDGTTRPARPASSCAPEVNALVLLEDERGEHDSDKEPRPHYE